MHWNSLVKVQKVSDLVFTFQLVNIESISAVLKLNKVVEGAVRDERCAPIQPRFAILVIVELIWVLQIQSKSFETGSFWPRRKVIVRVKPLGNQLEVNLEHLHKIYLTHRILFGK